MKALIVANGTLPNVGTLRDAMVDAEYVLAVDGGANALHQLGLTADAVLGDFDSLADGVLPDVPRIPAPDQDYTDLDKAVQYLIGANASSVIMTGVTGSRLDHTFGALGVLVKYGRRIDIALLDDIGEARLVSGCLSFTVSRGTTVSLLPLGLVSGVVTTGLKWPLTGESLQSGVRDGISNETVSESVSVAVESGDLIVYIHHST